MGREIRWWGWGDQQADGGLGPAAETMLREHFGDPQTWPRPEAFDRIELPPAAELPSKVIAAVGEGAVSAEQEARVRHAVGKSYADLARLRQGRLENAPDAVVMPASAEVLPELFAECAEHRVAVVPFGGGTSVVGGVEAIRGSHRAVISLDLSLFCDFAFDKTSMLAMLGAGHRGPGAEKLLNEWGVTLGHVPQSFEQATIGGFAATRSAGQASTGYGRFDDLVSSLRLMTPVGEIETLGTPHTAAGPALRELILGSEGCFGVIRDVVVRVRPEPESRRYEAWYSESFEGGVDLVRKLTQAGAAPDVIRLSDEAETGVTMANAGPTGVAGWAFDRYTRLRGVAGGCLIIAGWEGAREDVRRRRAISAGLMRAEAGVYLGQGAGRSWLHGRYAGPYLRDTLLDRGLMVETLETSQDWRRLRPLYGAVSEALSDAMSEQGTPGLVNCHLSHAYADGASLYFTFICRANLDDPVGQWRTVKRAASDAIVACGGTITHHHAVGRDHLPWMMHEVGETGVEVLRALKQELDPAGIMNPGKLIP